MNLTNNMEPQAAVNPDYQPRMTRDQLNDHDHASSPLPDNLRPVELKNAVQSAQEQRQGMIVRRFDLVEQQARIAAEIADIDRNLVIVTGFLSGAGDILAENQHRAQQVDAMALESTVQNLARSVCRRDQFIDQQEQDLKKNAQTIDSYVTAISVSQDADEALRKELDAQCAKTSEAEQAVAELDAKVHKLTVELSKRPCPKAPKPRKRHKVSKNKVKAQGY